MKNYKKYQNYYKKIQAVLLALTLLLSLAVPLLMNHENTRASSDSAYRTSYGNTKTIKQPSYCTSTTGGTVTDNTDYDPEVTSSIRYSWYSATTVKSYLNQNTDGTYTRVEALNTQVIVENYPPVRLKIPYESLELCYQRLIFFYWLKWYALVFYPFLSLEIMG